MDNQPISDNIPVVEIVPRSVAGSSHARRARKDGMIPAVVYHRAEASFSALLSERDFVKIASQRSSSQVFELRSTDSKVDKRSAIVKAIQKDRLTGKLTHVDFLALKDDEEINISIPLHVQGESVGVKNDGGILSVLKHEVEVACLPRAIPRFLSIDVSALGIGDSIHGGDLTMPAGVRLVDSPEETLVTVVQPRAEEEQPAVVEGAEGETAVAADGETEAGADVQAEQGAKGADGKKDK
ncbi:MAG TPA: 50S ribosomal protein L25 [Oligoflexia bacterium]|nr:50S ribosomal protein L25 [Oligoflexia bacterium]HMP26743.1 50S ribosomal protein L25 [Oligoflexia bacterium]